MAFRAATAAEIVVLLVGYLIIALLMLHCPRVGGSSDDQKFERNSNCTVVSKKMQQNGLRLAMVHRNSPLSPIHKLLQSKLEELKEARLRDLARIQSIIQRLQRASSSFSFDKALRTRITSGEAAGSGQYFINFSIGTPPQSFLLIADTGSDLTWVRCSYCHDIDDHNCANDGSPFPTFMASASSTYTPIPCLSSQCLLVPPPPHFSCNFKIPSTCKYDYPYADTSETVGVFSWETITINSSSSSSVVRVPNIAFGCGLHDTGESFVGSSGVLGLGRGSISFPSQISSIAGTPQFSYCLMDFFNKNNHSPSSDQRSYLQFGGTFTQLQYTPLLSNPFGQSFYYVGVEKIMVNGEVLPIPDYVWDIDGVGNGGTVVDSGTTLTFFVESAYRPILRAIAEALIYPMYDGIVNSFDLCFNASGILENDLTLPKVGICMHGNACFLPPPSNYFIDMEDGLKCLAMQGVDSPFGFSVLGNLIQQNFLMQFDVQAMQLGFAPSVC